MLKLQNGDAFAYVAAGAYSINHGGLCLYIKYTDKNPNKVTQEWITPQRALFHCPDRTIMMCVDGHNAYAPPVGFDYDECVDLTPLWQRNSDTSGFMLNYAQYINKNDNTPMYRVNGKKEDDPIIFCDSGGFQIKSERLDYINPEMLMKFYEDNVDIGIALDIPQGGWYWKGLPEKAATAQKKILDYMMERKSERLELMNVVHGYDLKSCSTFLDIVDTDGVDRLAIAGHYHTTLLQSIDLACQVMTGKHEFKHFHMLGVSKIQQMIPYMRIAAKGIAPMLTTDSSTWLQEGINKKYFVWTQVHAAPRYLDFGRTTNVPNIRKILPCSCPVCSAIKYQDVLACFQGNVMNFVCAYHNMWSFTSYTRAMYEIVKDSSLKDLKQLMAYQLETRSGSRDESLACLDYVDSVAKEGCEMAAKRNAYFLNIDTTVDQSYTGNLFSVGSVIDGEDDEDSEEDHERFLPPEDPNRQRLDRILDTYIRGDGSDKAAVAVNKKDKIKKTSGHAKTASSVVKIPGKKRPKK